MRANKVFHVPEQLLIGGDWRPGDAGVLEVIDPATEQPIATVADATVDQALDALTATAGAATRWRQVAPRQRSEFLRAVYEQVMARTEQFAALITAESGKPLTESRAEVAYGADFIRWFSEEAVRLPGGSRTAPAGGGRQWVHRRPVGPALLITPWNFPLAMATRKIAPALAAGCPVIVKPASATPLTTLLLTQIIRDELTARDLPTNALSVITTSSTSQVSEALLNDPRLRKLSFTGSTGVGRTLLRGAAQQVLRTSMELGGNAPFLVFGDADVDDAVQGLLAAKMRNAGQTCVAANRILVHDSVARRFTEQLTAAFAGMQVGPGTQQGVQVGPLINARAVESMEELVQTASDDGARITTGGSAPAGPGYFYNPTVVADIAPDNTLLRQEIFGPVAPITRFSTDEEAIQLANNTESGLVAYAYTRDLDRALRLTEELEAGMIGINRGMVSDASAPFGGVKTSGLGREGGEAGIEEYLEPVYICL